MATRKRPFTTAQQLNRPGKLQKTVQKQLLNGPLHDVRYIELTHAQPRPPPKQSLLDNPKSPVANLAAALAIPINYHFTDLFDPTANRHIVRSVPCLAPFPRSPLPQLLPRPRHRPSNHRSR